MSVTLIVNFALFYCKKKIVLGIKREYLYIDTAMENVWYTCVLLG